MTLALSGLEFVHELLIRVHVEDPVSGYCLRCTGPLQFHPCSIRARIVVELEAIGHLPRADADALLSGKAPCPCSLVTASTPPACPATILTRDTAS